MSAHDLGVTNFDHPTRRWKVYERETSGVSVRSGDGSR